MLLETARYQALTVTPACFDDAFITASETFYLPSLKDSHSHRIKAIAHKSAQWGLAVQPYIA